MTNKINLNKLTEDAFDDAANVQRNLGARRKRRAKRSQTEVLAEVAEYASTAKVGAEAVFQPTFTGSRHEREWILNYLGYFYEDRQIVDVLRRVKGGKEANVYCCLAHPDTGLEHIAAKVYRPRMFRQLRNDARYRQGRIMLDAEGKEIKDWRRLHAVAKKTRFGQEVLHSSWLEHEYQTLITLHQAGVSVPQPVARSANTILMEYLGELDEPAPALSGVRLDPAEARRLFERLMNDVELMLANSRVHGDLSAYNVLYWEGTVKIIDFPQAVDPHHNPDAWDLFQRDVERLCQYFARLMPVPSAFDLAHGMWSRYVAAVPAEAIDPAELVTE